MAPKRAILGIKFLGRLTTPWAIPAPLSTVLSPLPVVLAPPLDTLQMVEWATVTTSASLPANATLVTCLLPLVSGNTPYLPLLK